VTDEAARTCGPDEHDGIQATFSVEGMAQHAFPFLADWARLVSYGLLDTL
jgi:hypothetical protein